MVLTVLANKDSNAYGKTDADILHDFKYVVQKTTLHDRFPFNFDSDFVNLHFGKERNRPISFPEFTQIIHDFHDEHAYQAFQKYDKLKNGTITPADFQEIMLLLKKHILTSFVSQHLVPCVNQGEKQLRVSYAYFIAFIALLENMDLVKQIYLSKSNGNKRYSITKDEFLQASRHFNQITPIQVDILYQLVDLMHNDGRVTYEDLSDLAPVADDSDVYSQFKAVQSTVERQAAGKGRTILISVLEQVYRFTLGAIAGSIGATAVYPIDLVKTRMQNQRTGSATGELMYKSSWDCFRKVIRFEGFIGLYRGLGPQLIGVAPEKAIKLTVNDLVKDWLSDANGEIHLAGEIIAGGSAGMCQVIFTNPLEIVKIRLQVAGEIASAKRISALSVMRDLGFFGLYKGARACLLRDIPFSGIYFPAYHNLKKLFVDNNGVNSPISLLFAATLSGAPAACLTTPADVIKTRLQVVARQGQTSYTGVIDAGRKIWREEGGRAFWKGAPARVFRSSPQFGVTLFVYEMLQRTFYVDFGGRKTSGSAAHIARNVETLPANPDFVGGYKFACETFTGIERRLGLCVPKYSVKT